MIIRCIDFETTNLPSEDGGDPPGIMESGWCDLVDETITKPRGHLVNPGKPVDVRARAVHHISDKDVAGEMSPTEACTILMGVTRPPYDAEPLERADYFAAHNIDHEKLLFGGGETPWLCTYKAGLRVWPEAPGHKLQELRYFLGIDEDPGFVSDFAAYPHRAPDDAYVCAWVLRRMIADLSAQPDVGSREKALQMIARWSKGPALVYMCFFKKHRNKPWAQVAKDDPEYLEWVWHKSDTRDRDILATVRYHLQLIGRLPTKRTAA